MQENWLKSMLSQSSIEMIKSILNGSENPMSTQDLLREIPCNQKDEKWIDFMTLIINANFKCSKEGFIGESSVVGK